MYGGGWGQEERQAPYFPFQPNANFDILILVEPQAFKVRYFANLITYNGLYL